MKNTFKLRGKILSTLFLFIITVFIGQSCNKEVSSSIPRSLLKENIPSKVVVGTSTSGINSQIIYAGQSIKAGTVTYDDIDTNGDNLDDILQVTLQTIDGWEFNDISFFVGGTLAELPTNKSGNPIPGQFPFKSGNISGASTFIFKIPFSTIGFSCPNANTSNYYVAVHAGVKKLISAGTYQTETGWGDGLRLVSRGNWAMYNQIFISCDVKNDPPVSATTETAFAFDGDPTGCFQNYASFIDNPQRWGWTNGPYTQGVYTFKIYAGAGLCDLNKGVYVGDLKLDYAGSTVKVSYNLKGVDPQTNIPYELREVHVYVGNEEFPKIANGAQAGDYTIAPGKFPYKASNLTGQSYSFTINNLSGSVYLIAHAVVYGLPE